MSDVVMRTSYGTRELLESFRSTICPMCGQTKRVKQSMCSGCYAKLPADLKSGCYKHFRGGYEDAIEHSAAFLEVEALHLPASCGSEPGSEAVGEDVGDVDEAMPDPAWDERYRV